MSLAATWVDREIIILSEVSQRKINIIHYHLYMESKKKLYNELIYKTNRLTEAENKLMATKRKRYRGGIN